MDSSLVQLNLFFFAVLSYIFSSPLSPKYLVKIFSVSYTNHQKKNTFEKVWVIHPFISSQPIYTLVLKRVWLFNIRKHVRRLAHSQNHRAGKVTDATLSKVCHGPQVVCPQLDHPQASIKVWPSYASAKSVPPPLTRRSNKLRALRIQRFSKNVQKQLATISPLVNRSFPTNKEVTSSPLSPSHQRDGFRWTKVTAGEGKKTDCC